MKTADAYWNDFYAKAAYQHGKEPSAFLAQMLPRLQKGKALDIAMGEGVNAVFLAKQGFVVKGFDISQVAVKRASDLATENNVQLEAKRADLDMFLMGLMEYETIVMHNFKPNTPRYYSDMVRALKQGGTLIVESLMSEEMREPIGKDEAFRNFYFEPNELLNNLKGLRILFYHEGIADGKHVVQCLAKKPLDKDAVRYKLFDMHAKDVDAGPSRHQKLADQLFKKKD